MADNDQHDFDEFDHLTEETPAVELEDEDDLSFSKPSSGRKNRQLAVYAVLAGVIVVVIASVWFLFIRQPDNAGATNNGTLPVPVVAEEQNAAHQNGGNAALPPGVVSPDVGKPANTAENNAPPAPNGTPIVPVDPNSVNPEVATPQLASPEISKTENSTPPNATVSSTGTTAEALPPPIPPAAQNGATATPATAPGLPAPVAATPAETTAPAAATGMPAPALTPEAAPAAATAPTGMPTPANAPAMTATTPAVPAPAGATETMPPASTTTPAAHSAAATSAPIPATADNSAETKALTDENASLKEQIKTLNEKLDQATQQATSLEQQNRVLNSEVSSKEAKPETTVSSDAPKPAKKKAAKKASSVSKSSGSTSATSKWELRSAQPGAAWLGKVGKDDLVRYTIGQTVPGLGTVQDVTQEGGRWIVKTTGGTLRE